MVGASAEAQDLETDLQPAARTDSFASAGCVWDVAFLADGDLVTACADATARVWSGQDERQAPQQERETFQAALAAYTQASAPLR